MDDSIKSTYRTTCGANVSRRCWWKRPFFKLSACRLKPQLFVGRWPFDGRRLTVHPQIVVENLEQGERIPGVGQLLGQHGVHVDGEEGPEDLGVFHQ